MRIDAQPGIRARFPTWVGEVEPLPMDLSRQDSVAIRRPGDGRQFVLTKGLYQMLVVLAGTPASHHDEILAGYSLEPSSQVYEQLEVVLAQLNDERPRFEAPGFVFRRDVISAPLAAAVGGRLTGLFVAKIPWFTLAALLFVDFWIIVHTHLDPLNLTYAPLAILALVLSAVFHEFGHAAALVKGGRKPGPIGEGIYIIWPVLYADTSESWFLERRSRMLVDAAGVYFQLLFAAVTGLAAAAFSSTSLAMACLLVQAATVVNFNPLFRYDGHWLLADWLGVPNLYRSGRQAWRSPAQDHSSGRDRLILRIFWALAVTFWPIILGSALVAFIGQTVVLIHARRYHQLDLFSSHQILYVVTLAVLAVSGVKVVKLLLKRRAHDRTEEAAV